MRGCAKLEGQLAIQVCLRVEARPGGAHLLEPVADEERRRVGDETDGQRCALKVLAGRRDEGLRGHFDYRSHDRHVVGVDDGICLGKEVRLRIGAGTACPASVAQDR